MNLEVQEPELVQRVNAHIQTGHFHNADDVLEKALDEQAAGSLPPRATGAVVLAALQARPYPDITVVTRDRTDFDKARVPVFNPWEP